jgi:hypothetical protein
MPRVVKRRIPSGRRAREVRGASGVLGWRTLVDRRGAGCLVGGALEVVVRKVRSGRRVRVVGILVGGASEVVVLRTRAGRCRAESLGCRTPRMLVRRTLDSRCRVRCLVGGSPGM